MNQLKRLWVWLSRIAYCRGFGIQSPTDYAFVRYVINEHWPYYAYQQLDALSADWLTRKMGRLYFRLANWRRPQCMEADAWQPYFGAGCRTTVFKPSVERVELARIDISQQERCRQLLSRCDAASVLVIENIFRDTAAWHSIQQDERVGTTFDLYYCGIVLFDTKRFKHSYKINF